MSSPKSPLSVSHIAASALAASSAAFAASYLGVAGTIIGAALASVIATVAGAMYGASLQRSSDAVRRTASQLVRSPGPAAAVTQVHTPTETALGTPQGTAQGTALGTAQGPVDADETQVLLIAPEPPRPERSRVSPTRIAVGAAAALAITLGALTGLEGVLGKPISTLLGGSDASGTSISSAVTGRTGTADRTPVRPTKQGVTPTPTPAPVVTPTPTPTAPPTEIPTPTPTPTPAPTDPPTTEPTEPPIPEPTPSTP